MFPSIVRRREAREDLRPQRGRRGEQLVRAWLERRGFVIEATNVRYPVGELDLVVREGATLCFTEVRSSSSDACGGALASVRGEKQRRIIRAAQWYLQRRANEPIAARFDVVSVAWRPSGPPVIELVRGAFDASGYVV